MKKLQIMIVQAWVERGMTVEDAVKLFNECLEAGKSKTIPVI
jgi:hypothetical protein